MIVKLLLSIISIVFSLVMIYITQINFKKNFFNRFSYFVWLSVWILLIVISIRPKVVDSYFLNNYNTDIFYVLSIIGIIALVILSYIFFVKINILEKKINSVIRAESLKEILDKLKEK